MADNFVTDPGTAGITFGSDDIAGVHYPITKLTFGALDSQTIASSNTGNADAGTQRVVLATDQHAVTVDLGANNDVTIDGSTIIQTEDTASLGAEAGFPIFAVRRDADTSLVDTTGDWANLQVDARGFLKVEIFDGGESHTIDGTITADAGVNLNTSALLTNTNFQNVFGTTSLVTTAVLGDAVATSQDVFNVRNFNYVFNGTTFDLLREGAVAGSMLVDGSGVTQPISAASLPLPAGAATLAAQLADGHNVTVDNASGASAVNIQDGGNVITVDNGGTFATQATLQAGSALAADVGISGARTAGGTTLHKNIDVDETEDAVKATAGQVYWIYAMNLSASILFLKFYNATVATVIVGTTVPDLTFPIPTQGDTNGAGFVLAIPNGIEFTTAITIACTTGVLDNDAGAPGANECVVNLGFA